MAWADAVLDWTPDQDAGTGAAADNMTCWAYDAVMTPPWYVMTPPVG